VTNVRVVLLYPAGRVSPFQEAQMSALGGNVIALAVPGTFDDCQRLVKAAFLDPSLEALKLSSANSINIGRLIPQSFYYFASYLSMSDTPGEPVVFSVPSGNLGNLTAGVMAQRLGLPVRRFVAAANVNDVLPEYLRTGMYRARPAISTLSSAMDVGDPSNFPRLLELHGGDLAGCNRISKDHGQRGRDASDDPHGLRATDTCSTRTALSGMPLPSVQPGVRHRTFRSSAWPPPIQASSAGRWPRSSASSRRCRRLRIKNGSRAIESLPDTRSETFRDS
jgi:threonine synthase